MLIDTQNFELRTPKPLSSSELERVDDFLRFRDAMRGGPYYSVLEPHSFTNEQGKVNKRKGFDPFTHVEKYTARYHKAKRTVPDLSHREYGRFASSGLSVFWPTLANQNL